MATACQQLVPVSYSQMLQKYEIKSKPALVTQNSIPLLTGCCCREAEREALAEANKRERKRQRRGGAAFVDWGD
jgi:hypothetical protein